MPAEFTTLTGPFPYFGTKYRVAGEIWARFGNPVNYIEPFCGSCSILLSRPSSPRHEIINDKDLYIANFWRAVMANPEGVARAADWPKSEADLHSRHRWLVQEGAKRISRCLQDPFFYDVLVAGWWVWGQCHWLGGEWCCPRRANNRSRWDSGSRGILAQKRRPITEYLQALSTRLAGVKVLCGDWKRAVQSKQLLFRFGNPAAVFLDPPYGFKAGRQDHIYATDSLVVADEVREWALDHGDDPRLRIALCGYDREHEHLMPSTWECLAWEPSVGLCHLGNGRGRKNRTQERIWFSPHCSKVGAQEAAA